MTRTIYGRSVRATQSPAVTLMWTTTFVPKKPGDFRPDHFVVLTEPDRANSSVGQATPYTPMRVVPKPTRTTSTPTQHVESPTRPELSDITLPGCGSMSVVLPRQEEVSDSDVSFNVDSADTSKDSVTNSLGAPIDSVTDSPGAPIDSVTDSPGAPVDSVTHTPKDSHVAPKDSYVTPKDSVIQDSHIDISADLSLAAAEGGKNLPSGPKPIPNFLPLEDVIRVFREADRETVPKYVPRGRKENVYFVVDNLDNLKKREKGERSEFWDDCGAWATGGPTNKYHYLHVPGQKLSKDVWKEDKFCWERQRNKKTVYIPIVPQPDPEDVVVVHRRYVKHTLSSNYEKRVTWLENADVSHEELHFALYEYRGKFPGNSKHGNAITQGDYVRMKPTVRDNIKEEAKTKKAREVFRNCDLIDGPRHEKQIRDIQHHMRKKDHVQLASGTFADQIVHRAGLTV